MAIMAGAKKYRQILHKIVSFQLQLPLLAYKFVSWLNLI